MNKVFTIALCLLTSAQTAYGCCGVDHSRTVASTTCVVTECTGTSRVDQNNNIVDQDETASESSSTQDFESDETE